MRRSDRFARALGAGVLGWVGNQLGPGPFITFHEGIERGEGVLAAAIAGLGIATASAFACDAELERGVLIRLLETYSRAPIDVHAILPTGRRPPVKARKFIDYLSDVLKQPLNQSR